MDWPLFAITGMHYSQQAFEKYGKTEGLLKSRHFKTALLGSLPITAATGWIYTKTPDWMNMYYTDHRKIPKPMQAGLILMYPVMLIFGYLLAPQLEGIEKGLTKKAIASIVALDAIYITLSYKRFLRICTTEEFEKGEGKNLLFHPNTLRWMLVFAMEAAYHLMMTRELEREES
jgi:hypothetical protein